MATWIQINNINEGDLDAGDALLNQFAADDTRLVEILDGDESKVASANFDKPLSRAQLLKSLDSEQITEIVVSTDTADDLKYFRSKLPKSKWQEKKGYWSSNVRFALK